MSHELTWTEFSSWLDEYKQACETFDERSAAKIFTQTATYSNSRFYSPYQGYDGIIEFWRYEWILNKENIEFSYELLACRECYGICRWKATLTDLSDFDKPKRNGHSGIFLCHFATAKLVKSLEEWRVIEFI